MFEILKNHYSRPRGVRNIYMGKNIGNWAAKKSFGAKETKNTPKIANFEKFIFAIILVFLITQILNKIIN